MSLDNDIIMNSQKIKGIVVLMQKKHKNVLDITSSEKNVEGVFDGDEPIPDSTPISFLDKSVALKLVSATKADSSGKGIVGSAANLEDILIGHPALGPGQSAFSIHFDYESKFGIPGAFYIKNYRDTEFFLVSVTLDGIPNHGTIRFVCNSWIYNAKKYQTERIFFANDTYVPSTTPTPLVSYREQELESLRGDGTGERQEWERIYDYDVYNDLGDPDNEKDRTLARPVLGGHPRPYPRRGRTGRKPTKKGITMSPVKSEPTVEKPEENALSIKVKTEEVDHPDPLSVDFTQSIKDPESESKSSTYYYIPRDEDLGHLRFLDPPGHGLKSLSQRLLSVFDKNSTPEDDEFESFEDVYDLFKDPHFPPPYVFQESESAWMTDVEFAREILAGVNPVLIRCLHEFPPTSKLYGETFGDHTSTITKEDIEHNLEGLTVDEAIQKKKLFLLDHHDLIIPYLKLINSTTTKAYASRTFLFLRKDGTLKPLAIELSRPHSHQGVDQYVPFGVSSKVYLPAEGVESSIWLLAKAYVLVNDSCYHQLVSHWLHTHAVVEPFVIATNRQLSALHPIYKLLHPHYRDTMNINAFARKTLINAGSLIEQKPDGIIEKTFLWGRYAMEMSSVIYSDWVFPEQALPADLLKRGMAVEDETSPNGVRLVIEDYPYAADGLDIWGAIKTWVKDYVSLYYPTDDAVKEDTELQAWWKEVVHKGHADLKDRPWWSKMQTRHELIETCTTLIWTTSALHAAVNFGQYPYGGLILNRPTLSRRFMPEKNTPEYDELEKDTQKGYLMTITPKAQTIMDLTTIEFLSAHGSETSDEKYLGDRDNAEYWTSDTNALEAFKKFGKTLAEIETRLDSRNKNETLKNRVGPVKMPYTLLFPTSKPPKGITFMGIPNSISI